MLLVHFPGRLSDLGATEARIGILYSAAALLSLLVRPAFGRILDLTHRRTVMLSTGLINFIVIAGFATAGMWGPYLWVLFLLQRVAQLALFTSFLTYSADSIPLKRRTQGLAIYGLSGLVPIAVGGYVGDVVIDIAGFGGLFLVASVASFSSWLIVWGLPVLPVRGHQPRRGFWAAVTQPNLLPLWFVTLIFAVGLEAIFTFTRTYVDNRRVGTAGLFFAVYGISAAVTRVIGGRQYDRIPHRPLLVGSIIGYGFGLVLMAIAQSIPVLIFAGMAVGTSHGAAFPLLSSEVVNRARVAERGSAMSIFTSVFDMAVLVGAPAVGLLIEGFSYRVAFSAAGGLLIVGSLVYAFWDGRLMAGSTLVVEELLE